MSQQSNIKKEFTYSAFGLNLSSEYMLPELTQIKPDEEHIDITIRLMDLTALWSDLREPNRYFVVKDSFILFQVPGVAIFLIEKGKNIIISPMKGNQEDQIRLYILGTCMGAALMQRRILPLHGSAIAIDGQAYAIVGNSGAGKSTLASAFLKRGCHLLSDDVIPVTLSKKGIPIVNPAYPQQKLWQESLTQFGMDSSKLNPIIDREQKFVVPVLDQFAQKPLPLAGVIELVKTEYEESRIRPVHNLEGLHTLFLHTYRNFLIARAGLMKWHFNMTTQIADQISLYQLQRPSSHFTTTELTRIVLKTIKKEKIIHD